MGCSQLVKAELSSSSVFCSTCDHLCQCTLPKSDKSGFGVGTRPTYPTRERSRYPKINHFPGQLWWDCPFLQRSRPHLCLKMQACLGTGSLQHRQELFVVSNNKDRLLGPGILEIPWIRKSWAVKLGYVMSVYTVMVYVCVLVSWAAALWERSVMDTPWDACSALPFSESPPTATARLNCSRNSHACTTDPLFLAPADEPQRS